MCTIFPPAPVQSAAAAAAAAAAVTAAEAAAPACPTCNEALFGAQVRCGRCGLSFHAMCLGRSADRLGKPFTCARCAAGGAGRSGVGSLKRPTEGGGRQSKRSASLLKKARGGAAGALGL